MIANMNQFKTSLSKNLVSNQPKHGDVLAGVNLDDRKLEKFKTNVPKREEPAHA